MNIKEVAIKSGVSTATVSRVINNSGPVSAATREKVIKALGKNKIPTRRRKPINTAHNLSILMLPGCEEDSHVVLNKLLTISGSIPDRWTFEILPRKITPEDLNARYYRGEISGIFLVGHHISNPEFLHTLHEIPYVWLNSHNDRLSGKRVIAGNELAGRMAADYLITLKCANPVVIDFQSINPGVAARIDGFRFEFFSRNYNCQILKLNAGKLSNGIENEKEEVIVEELASAFQLKPSGLFIPEEKITALFYRSCANHKKRIRIPIVSCNYTMEYLCGLYPRPASISLGPEKLARLALEELQRKITKGHTEKHEFTTIVSPQFINGDMPSYIK